LKINRKTRHLMKNDYRNRAMMKLFIIALFNVQYFLIFIRKMFKMSDFIT